MNNAQERGWSDFSVEEWHRLSDISMRHESSLRLAYTKAVQTRIEVSESSIRTAITFLLAEVCDTTSSRYGLVFNTDSPVYSEVVDTLTDQFITAIDSPQAKSAVARLVPRSVGTTEYARRTDTYGLDSRAAIRIEQMHQTDEPNWKIQEERTRSIMIRGNLLATTEANRVVNQALLALWRDNSSFTIHKARRRPKVEYIGTSRRRIVESVHKVWMTRRDDKVCKYCDPLDGIAARLDAEFDTRYGIFDAPPIHPNCRCFMVLG